MAPFVHPTSLVHPDAQLGADVVIGPFCTVGGGVKLGLGSRLDSFVTIAGCTTIGSHNHLGSYSSLGSPPQDVRYNDELVRLVVGDRNIIGQGVTFNAAKNADAGPTTIGSRGRFEKASHVAHDCIVGDDVIFEAGSAVAGHCRISDAVSLGRLSAVQQFTRIGAFAVIEDGCAVTSDVIPFGLIGSPYMQVVLNKAGLQSLGIDADATALIERLFKTLQDDPLSLTLDNVPAGLRSLPMVKHFVAFAQDSRLKRDVG